MDLNCPSWKKLGVCESDGPDRVEFRKKYCKATCQLCSKYLPQWPRLHMSELFSRPAADNLKYLENLTAYLCISQPNVSMKLERSNSGDPIPLRFLQFCMHGFL